MAQSPFQPLAILALNLEEDSNDRSRVPGSLPLLGGTCTFLWVFFPPAEGSLLSSLEKRLV